MLTTEQFEKAKAFIYRHGDLLTRKRFGYHFEGASKQAVLDALACYQNEDGGFGNGLELDIMCPESSGICMEVALGYLDELGVTEGPVFERAVEWILRNRTENGDLPHPAKAVKRYPHGEWWGGDANRILSVAGLLGKMGRSHPEITARASTVFKVSQIPFPDEIGVYLYPLALYLRHADGAEKYAQYRQQLEAAVPAMLERDAWLHPLFMCHNRWDSEDIPASLWQSEAGRIAKTLQEDGGVFIEQYAMLSWWRPVWTIEMLVIMKRKGLL